MQNQKHPIELPDIVKQEIVDLTVNLTTSDPTRRQNAIDDLLSVCNIYDGLGYNMQSLYKYIQERA
jgi:hypothetical protein